MQPHHRIASGRGVSPASTFRPQLPLMTLVVVSSSFSASSPLWELVEPFNAATSRLWQLRLHAFKAVSCCQVRCPWTGLGWEAPDPLLELPDSRLSIDDEGVQQL
ncbi:hypothetical protein TSOC_003307 [Tetrabaena socialis]|uniref:Uncharacterized protein n=1 Tax=Tetrabaena socialis TaxID=47790 RepID=A0A2J8ABX8_9CHLO|nr:hypothetical protein TSOC_003307 [Tetrabaena socialis]|eukprot:PNH10021.1 hypothetical protein TSOC_003307 [Tetrabaena socialis]